MTNPLTILIVDDEYKMQEILKKFFTSSGYNIICASNTREAIGKFSQNNIDLVITDIKMPGKEDGISLVRKIHNADPYLPIVVITAYGNIPTSVLAMKEGAYDYIVKPFDLDEFKIVIERALKTNETQRELKRLREEVEKKYCFSNIIGKSKKMQDIFDTINKISSTSSTVLIYGETGSGKELIAKAIHYNSSHKEAPFICLNCSAIPSTLLESELFGYCKGAFTDAYKDKPGYLELAKGGSIFLDEIGDTEVFLQAKLLRCLEHKKFLPLGGTAERETEVRFIAATNKNLKEKIAEGKFREDLFYRLNVISINIPPLRERKEDIPLLLEYFLSKYQKQFTLSRDALQIFLDYHWPGNVRELENAVERITLLSKDNVISPEDISEDIKKTEDIICYNAPYSNVKEKFLSQFEKNYFSSLLLTHNHDIVKCAKFAKISSRHLYRKIKEYRLDTKNTFGQNLSKN